MFFHEFEQMIRWLKGDKKPPKRRPGTFF
jgi:hypothetical protein